MRLLLDTHSLLWWLNESPRLQERAAAAIADSRNRVFVSCATIWELSIKRNLGKLNVPDNFLTYVDREGFELIPITEAHSWVAGALPLHHHDPFDRMLIAQADLEVLTIVTSDPMISRYGVPVLEV